jgi:hypothetical protein
MSRERRKECKLSVLFRFGCLVALGLRFSLEAEKFNFEEKLKMFLFSLHEQLHCGGQKFLFYSCLTMLNISIKVLVEKRILKPSPWTRNFRPEACKLLIVN